MVDSIITSDKSNLVPQLCLCDIFIHTFQVLQPTNYSAIYLAHACWCCFICLPIKCLLPPFLYIGGIVFRTNINAQVRQLIFVGFRRESGGK
jgi:hypothetical protein